MKRIRVVGVCLVAVFALSAVAVSSASATVGLWQIKKSMTFGSEKINSAAISITSGKLKGDGIEISCPSLKIEGGLIDEGATGKATSAVFSGCKELVKSTKCKLKSETIATEPGSFTLISTNEIEIKPTGTEFVTVTVEPVEKAECTIEGKYTVTGSAILEVGNPQTEEVEHLLDLSSTKSKLKINSNAATIEGSGKGKLEKEEPWCIWDTVACTA